MKLDDLTSREKALLAYFYEVGSDPKIATVGWSFSKISTAVLTCVEHDLKNVLRFALGKTAEWAGQKASPIARGVAQTMLGGIASDKAAAKLAEGAGLAVLDLFARLGTAIDQYGKKPKASSGGR